MKNRNVYLTILTIVTVICVIAGSCYHIIGWGVSLAEDFLDSSFWNFLNDEKEDAGALVSSDTYELGDFSTITVNASVMSLKVVPGDSATISYKGNEKLTPKYEVVDGALRIEQNVKTSNMWGNKKCNVTLTLPRDCTYESVEISSDVGDIDLTGLDGDYLCLDAAVGDIDLTDCHFAEIELTADVGDVDLEDCGFDTLNVDASVGDIDVESAIDLSDYTISLETDIGEVSVNDRDYRRSYSQDGSTGKTIEINNSTGDISLDY